MIGTLQELVFVSLKHLKLQVSSQRKACICQGLNFRCYAWLAADHPHRMQGIK